MVIYMNDYTNYKSQPNYEQISGNIHYNNQLSQEGSFIKVDGNEFIDIDNKQIKYKAIVRAHGNEYNENKEERIVLFDKSFNINSGSLIEYLDEPYLVFTHRDKDNPFMDSVKMFLCNETLNWKGLGTPEPCIVEGESYGVKIVSSNDLREGVDTKVKISVQDNVRTRTITPNTRFIFNHSKYGIYEVGDVTVYKKGILTFTCKKSDYREEDDLENNIAFNEGVDIPTELPTIYAIIGEENVRKGKEYLYTLSPKEENIEWSISDDTVVTMRIDDDKNCILCILKSDDYITLNASLDGKIVASKDLFTM